MVLFMLCSDVLVEWLLLKPCCVEMCGMLFVMYGSSVFSRVLLSLREVRWVYMRCLCSCLCLVTISSPVSFPLLNLSITCYVITLMMCSSPSSKKVSTIVKIF